MEEATETAAAAVVQQSRTNRVPAIPSLRLSLGLRNRRNYAMGIRGATDTQLDPAAAASVGTDLAEALNGSGNLDQTMDVAMAAPAAGLTLVSEASTTSLDADEGLSPTVSENAPWRPAAGSDDMATADDSEPNFTRRRERMKEPQSLQHHNSPEAVTHAAPSASTDSQKAAFDSSTGMPASTSATKKSRGNTNINLSKYTADEALLSMDEKLGNEKQFGALVNRFGSLLLGKNGPRIQYQVDKVRE